MTSPDLSQYLADEPPSVVRLEIEKHFAALNDQQKRYAHFISKACYAGTRIVLRQLSPESEPIFDMILALHKSCHGNWKSLAEKAGVDDAELSHFLQYAAMFLGNLGNYKSFGDSKFLPRCSQKTLAALCDTCSQASQFYKATHGAIFSSDKPAAMHLGFPDAGHMTMYYPDSPDITQAEIKAVSAWMESKKLLPENTRLRKRDGGKTFEILIASALTHIPKDGSDIGKETCFTVDQGLLKGKTIKLVFGDYSKEMGHVVAYIDKAAINAGNDHEKNMHHKYATSFETGSLEAYKDSQRSWIKDKGPMVECNIGFVETYRDPAGVRGEWEGFASMVNLERTRTFGELVAAAPKLIPLLPWSKDFEKDKFLSPDFTSLEVLTFNGSGIPAGINIPNYDDIRQTEGFKNVSLGNVLSAKSPSEKIPFIRNEDLDIYKKYRDASFEVQVGLHELTGHGCGKLLQETSPGVFNFDKEKPPVSPITNKPITTWYKPDVLYASYLSMARAGLASLEMWDPKSRKWGQAHSQARFSILKCFLEGDGGFCKLDANKEDMSDLTIKLDRSKILTAGREAVAKYLQKLHIYKSTADVEAGTKFYLEMTSVDADYWGSKIRKVVLDNKQPRKVFVQANTSLDEASGKVSLKHYEASLIGMIESWSDRDL
ncbi:hypothetical protein CDD81_4372 [Ophiocordyceps australis]|uniref:Dipeptidyl peptidase 3 n=1 Tax=Ophiocordyceps australis TaxID=1399860 RepID=A0A2C5XDP8_9HYPO|nr:hypothetical protein CDD81_4372 [Ophiocordyceps australis]